MDFLYFSNMVKWDMKNSDDKIFYTLGEKEVCSEYKVVIIALAHKNLGSTQL